MPCYFPQVGYWSKWLTDNGKREWVANPASAMPNSERAIRTCGNCVGCRLEKSRQWAIRCMHESTMHENNCFLTLTYSNENLPSHGTLDKDAVPLFMKRLRKKVGKGPRVYYCGEYGDTFGRPHYHLCLFNYDFPDKKLHRESFTGHNLYVSEILEKLWPFGYSTIGGLTFDSAAYTARYVMKKVNGKRKFENYALFTDLSSGEVVSRIPEFANMSRRPGIAKPWFDEYHQDVYSYDSVIVKEQAVRPPKYYDRQFEMLYPEEMKKIIEARIEKHRSCPVVTAKRLARKHDFIQACLKKKERNLE